MNSKLLEQSIEVFGTPEKWNALFELYEQTGQIMNYWLSIGAKALIAEFRARPSLGWECRRWDKDHEVRWFMEDLKQNSVGIGFGWNEWQFHLHVKDWSSDNHSHAKEILKEADFRALLAVFGPQDKPAWRGVVSLASDVTFNPFSGESNAVRRQRELAWQAAHQTEEFVQKMSAKIREVTDNPVLTELIRQLNHRAQGGNFEAEGT